MKKQQKYRKTRKELTKCEALSSIANAKISIQNSQEFIDTCKSGYINGICLLVAINDFGSIENAIDGNIGIDVETVRVIEAKALRKLRHPLRRHFFE